jgi:alcohol dehydrogenase class IV
MPYGLEAPPFNVKEEDIARLAADTFKIQRLLYLNPVPITEDDLNKMFRRAMRNWEP